MSDEHQCPNGHSWQAATESRADEAPTCPACGSAALTIAGDALPPLPPAMSPANGGATRGFAGAAELSVEPFPSIPDHEITGVLGKGGMGIVYEAIQISLKRKVAIKMIFGGARLVSERSVRFRHEAQSLAQLQHPNTVQIFEIGAHDGCPYFSMEFVDGGSLSQKLADKPLASDEATKLIETLARAMQAAHQKGIIHRDLKPANVMITSEGSPKITDFGLAKQLDAGETLSQAGDIMGTPSYMAPEQAHGRIAEIGPAADTYALGAILYELLTGRPPFKGATSLETLDLVRHQEPTPPRKIDPKIPRDLETICLKCLRKTPAHRYGSALALAQDLERYRAGEAILARPEGPLAKLGRKVRRNRTVSTLCAALGLILIATAVLVYRSEHAARIGNLEARLESDRNEGNWTDENIRAHEALISELALQSTERGDRARKLWHESLSAAATGRLRKATALQPDDDAHVLHLIEILNSRDVMLADDLRQLRQKRLRYWEEVFAETAPKWADSQFVKYRNPPQPRETRLTKFPSQGNVRLESVWDSWENSTRIGLALNGEIATETTGYTFLLDTMGGATAPSKQPTQLLFKEIRERNGALRLSILRNGVSLRTLEVPIANVQAGPIRVECERLGDRLQVRINRDILLEARDLVPLSPKGYFGVVWPPQASLAAIRGLRQALPIEPGPLEHGDELFAQGRFDEARTFFAKHAIESAGAPSGIEARFKESLVLKQLNRLDDAIQGFQALTAEMKTQNTNKWMVLASLQLWAHYAGGRGQKNRDQADALFERLLLQQSLGKEERLFLYLPDDLRDKLRSNYRWEAGGFGMLRHRPNRVEHMQQVVKVEELLDLQPAERRPSQLALIRALRLEGRLDQAIRLAEQELRNIPFEEKDVPLRFVAEYAWMMREAGTPSRALPELESRLYQQPGIYRRGVVPLLVERARLHAALKKWEQAEKDLDEFFSASAQDQSAYGAWPDACLVLGMVREQRGDLAGAREAWQKGRAKKATAGHVVSSSTAAIHEVMLAMLCQDLQEEHAETLTLGVMGNKFDVLAFLDTKTLFRKTATIMNGASQTPRVKEVARQMILQTCSLRQYIQYPLQVALAEVMREEAFKEKADADQDELLWKFAEDFWLAISAGKISDGQAIQVMVLWKRGPSLLGGLEVVKGLDPSLRGTTAYLMGLRLQRLNQPADQAYRMAIENGSVNSTLERLARRELEKLSKKKAR